MPDGTARPTTSASFVPITDVRRPDGELTVDGCATTSSHHAHLTFAAPAPIAAREKHDALRQNDAASLLRDSASQPKTDGPSSSEPQRRGGAEDPRRKSGEERDQGSPFPITPLLQRDH